MFESSGVDALIEQRQQVSREDARLLQAIHRVCGATPVAEFAADEIAFALTWTRHYAGAQQQLARQLIGDLPAVFADLASGRIDLPKARVFAEVLAVLDPEVARDVAAKVLPVAPEKTTSQIRDRLRRRVLAADPDAAIEQRRRGEADRKVVLDACPDGTAALTALGLSPVRAAAAMERVNAIARARRAAGCLSTMDQLRADSLLDLLEGVGDHPAPAGRPGVIELTVSLETLALLSVEPADLAGFGPVSADIARQWALAHPDYQWRYSVYDGDALVLHGLTRARPTTSADPTPVRASAPSPRPPTGHVPEPGSAGGRASDSGSAAARASAPQPRPGAPWTTDPAAARTCGASPQASRKPTAKPGAAAPGTPKDQTAVGKSRPGGRRAAAMPPVQDPTARFANAATTRWIRARDRTCRAPGCRAPARACDIDHTIAIGQQGRTSHDNLGLLCRRHHRLKHEGLWQLQQPAPGVFIWTSPAGRRYERRSKPP